jgi:release factor glutamine methyltransferase
VKFEDFMHSYDILKTNGTPNPLLETLRLFDVLSGGKAHEVLCFQDPETVDVAAVAEKRRQGVPLEYILGRAAFMGRMFYCTSDTLIPRPETSLLVLTASDFLTKRKNRSFDTQTVIEIGTGCGNIAVSLALQCDEGVKILASDISPAAVEIAHRNFQKFNLQEKLMLFCGDLFEPFNDYQGNADMVICNPPYIPTTSLKNLASEIIDHEPLAALDGGSYGIEFFRRLITEASTFLKLEGALLFEIGEGQEKLIERLIAKKGAYKDIKYFRYKEKVRVVSAVRK